MRAFGLQGSHCLKNIRDPRAGGPTRPYYEPGSWYSSFNSGRKREGIYRVCQELPPQPMKIGVLLFNLGGPETLRDVKPFLYRLFSDPEIVRVKWGLLRKALAYTIATVRRRTSEGYYRQIGGGSPLRRLTEEQALALARELKARGRG